MSPPEAANLFLPRAVSLPAKPCWARVRLSCFSFLLASPLVSPPFISPFLPIRSGGRRLRDRGELCKRRHLDYDTWATLSSLIPNTGQLLTSVARITFCFVVSPSLRKNVTPSGRVSKNSAVHGPCPHPVRSGAVEDARERGENGLRPRLSLCSFANGRQRHGRRRSPLFPCCLSVNGRVGKRRNELKNKSVGEGRAGGARNCRGELGGIWGHLPRHGPTPRFGAL